MLICNFFAYLHYQSQQSTKSLKKIFFALTAEYLDFIIQTTIQIYPSIDFFIFLFSESLHHGG